MYKSDNHFYLRGSSNLPRLFLSTKRSKDLDDMIRKHILRRIALALGVPEESAMKPKKALQYGSSIHKYFKKIEGRRGRVLNTSFCMVLFKN